MFAVVLVVLVMSFAYPLRSWFDQRAQVAELTERIVAQQRENVDLAAAIERWDDPKFVEAQARQRLRYVMPGDAPFVVVGDSDPTASEDVVDAGPGGDWWERLWSTVEEADHPPEDLVGAAEPATSPTPAPGTGVGGPTTDTSADPTGAGPTGPPAQDGNAVDEAG